jgi:hypothetical protein
MKRILKLSILPLLFLSAIACSDDDNKTVVADVSAPVLISPQDGLSIVLTEDIQSNPALTLVWNHGAYSVPTEISYVVEAAVAGTDFEAPVTLGTTNNRVLALNVGELNVFAIQAGLVPFEQGTLEVRITASLGTASEIPMVSNILKLNVTPFTAILPKLYFVGAPQAYYGKPAWTPGEGIEMRYIGDGETKVFEAYVKVAAGEGFKFTGGLSWEEGNYGTVGGMQNGTLENSSGSSDIKIAETDGPGLYYVRVDIDNLTYKYSKMNWGMIGDATPGGWDNETPMTYDFTANKFTITTTLTAAQVKFRASNVGIALFPTENNNAWKFNVGNSDPITAYTPDTPNFSVTAAGTHTVELSIDILGNATVNGL